MRERIIVRKRVEVEKQRIQDEVRREHVDIEADPDLVVRDPKGRADDLWRTPANRVSAERNGG